MVRTTNAALSVAITATLVCVGISANAQTPKAEYVLPMKLAIEAASEAVQVCSLAGNHVTATVVDMAGISKVALRSDRASVNTIGSSYRKAYTIATMGPIWHFDLTSEFTEKLSKYPPLAVQALLATPDITAQRGGAAIQV